MVSLMEVFQDLPERAEENHEKQPQFILGTY
jgi:hypothetical protein